jgi:hypothetical protein
MTNEREVNVTIIAAQDLGIFGNLLTQRPFLVSNPSKPAPRSSLTLHPYPNIPRAGQDLDSYVSHNDTSRLRDYVGLCAE